jgi:hypothetical protein
MGRGSDETHTAPAKARSGLMYGSARRAQKLDVADLRAIQFWSMNDPDGSFEAAEEIAAEIRDRIGNWHPQHIGDILEPLAKYAPASVITDDKPKEYPTGMQSVSYALCVFMFDEVMVDHAVRWSQSFKAKYGCGPQERTVRLLVSGMRRRQMFGGEQEPVMILRNGLTEEGIRVQAGKMTAHAVATLLARSATKNPKKVLEAMDYRPMVPPTENQWTEIFEKFTNHMRCGNAMISAAHVAREHTRALTRPG